MGLFLCPNESKKSYTSLSLQGGTLCPGMAARVADLGPASPLTDWKVIQGNWTWFRVALTFKEGKGGLCHGLPCR